MADSATINLSIRDVEPIKAWIAELQRAARMARRLWGNSPEVDVLADLIEAGPRYEPEEIWTTTQGGVNWDTDG